MPPKRKQPTKALENGKRLKNTSQEQLTNSELETNGYDVIVKCDAKRRSGRLKTNAAMVQSELSKSKPVSIETIETKNNSVDVIENGPAKRSGGLRKGVGESQIQEGLKKEAAVAECNSTTEVKSNNVNRRASRRKSEILPRSEAGSITELASAGVKEKCVNKSISDMLKTEDCTQSYGLLNQVKPSYANVRNSKINLAEIKRKGPTKPKAGRHPKNDLKQQQELLSRMKANVSIGAKRKGSSSDSDFSSFSDDDSDSDFDENCDSKRHKGKTRKKLPAKNKLSAKRGDVKVNPPSVLHNSATIKPSLVVEMGKLSDSESDSEFVSVGTENVIDCKELATASSKVPDSILAFPKPLKSEDTESSESEWEEVDGHLQDDDDPDREPVIPKNGVEITLEMPDIFGKRRRREFDIEGHFRRKINRFKKRVQLNLHKVHLLCLLGHGMFVSQLVNSDELRAVALSIIPEEFFKINRKKADIAYLERTLQWFRDTLSLVEKDVFNQTLSDSLLAALEKHEASSAKMYNILFVLILRVLHFDVRFVMSLQPLPLKPIDLIRVKPKGDGASNKPSTLEVASSSKENSGAASTKQTSKPKRKSAVSSTKTPPEKKTVSTSSRDDVPIAGKNAKKSQAADDISGNEEKCSKYGKTLPKKGNKKNSKSDKQKPSDNAKPVDGMDEGSNSSRSLRRRTKNPIVDIENSEEEEENEKNIDPKRKSNKGKTPAKHSEEKGDSPLWSPEDNSDSDFEVEVVRLRPSPSVLTNRLKKNRKIKSEDEADDVEVISTTIGNDYWIEVYLDSAKKWICIDAVVGKVNCVSEMEGRATQSLKYVVTFDNQNYLKDVTRRYAENWMSQTRKLRVKAEWWEETLAPFRCKSTKRDKDEDRALEAEQMERPLPKTIGEFKSHPLYVLQRHLLKYEALYPPDVGPIGYIRKEAVYPRECVYTCYSRDSWLRMAKTVKIGEKPYKIVKGRPRWNKVLKVIEKSDQVPPLEVFGEWQVEDYDPPSAVNGKVPRNEYGNVDLYKPCMLPKGCVHLQVPGLKTVAKKLGIDCAGAVIGWDKTTWIPGPLYDGYIVCEEFADTLMEAWREQQQINEKRQREKREKRVWGNWRRVIRGLLIRERLHVRYFSKEEEEDNGPEDSEDVPA